MYDVGLAIFVYKRPWHTRKVLESIKANGIDQIYIFQDGLKDERDRDAWEEVSELIRKFPVLKKEIHISDTNKGLANSIIYGISFVMKKHRAVIALEDDVCLGKGYINYMSQCLDKYEDNDRVSCVAGGGWPVDIPENYQSDVFFSYRSSSIAWATWRDRWEKYSRDYTLLSNILKDENKKHILEKSGNDIFSIMQAQVLGRCDSWAVFWSLLQILNNQVCVLPVKYLARDIGHDGVNGTNSTYYTTRFDTVLYDLEKESVVFPEEIIVDDDIMNQIKMILNHPLPQDRMARNNDIMEKWLKCYQNGLSVGDYLIDRNVNSVYIYGAAKMAEFVVNEIKGKVEIKGILVRDKSGDSFGGYPLYDFSDDIILKNEKIIVTPVHDMEYIDYSVTKRYGRQELIGIDDILNDLLKEV